MSGGTVTRLSDRVFQPSPVVGGEIRRALRALLTGWGLPEQVLEDALLIVEEFVANVVDHARTTFEVVLERTADALRIAVRDQSDSAPVLREFDPLAARGRGLQLVGAVARNWGCDRHESGKTVWADVAAA
jgi:phosphoserine phosphatase RsbU/P